MSLLSILRLFIHKRFLWSKVPSRTLNTRGVWVDIKIECPFWVASSATYDSCREPILDACRPRVHSWAKASFWETVSSAEFSVRRYLLKVTEIWWSVYHISRLCMGEDIQLLLLARAVYVTKGLSCVDFSAPRVRCHSVDRQDYDEFFMIAHKMNSRMQA